MKPLIIKPAKKIYGRIKVPGDKSISHRALMIGAISKGRTVVKGLLDCDDCNYTMRALKDMGINITEDCSYTAIEGAGLRGLRAPSSGMIDAGQSGTTMRILPGILSGQDFAVTIKGDSSLSARPMKRVIEPLSLMGVEVTSAAGGYPPLTIKGGKVRPISYKMPIPSAQIKSMVLLAGLFADGTTLVEEAFKSRDHTERMLGYFGADIKIKGFSVAVKGAGSLEARQFDIPGDVSSASFFMAGAILLKDSSVKIEDCGINPTRAGILGVLKKMGADIRVTIKNDAFEPSGDIEVRYGRTHGTVVENSVIPSIIDELPIIFVVAALSDGKTVVKGAGELKVKETDRIRSMSENLSAMGAKVSVAGDDVVIEGVSRLKGADIKSYNDHRTCMAMSIAALAADGDSRIDDVECVGKSYPGFFGELEGLK